MLFFGRQQLKPRQFKYYPFFYDPEKDRENKERFNFGHEFSRQRSKYRQTRSPLIYLFFAALIIMIMYLLSPREESRKVLDDVELTEEEIPLIQVEVVQSKVTALTDTTSQKVDTLARLDSLDLKE